MNDRTSGRRRDVRCASGQPSQVIAFSATWRHVTPEAMTYDIRDFAPNMK